MNTKFYEHVLMFIFHTVGVIISLSNTMVYEFDIHVISANEFFTMPVQVI